MADDNTRVYSALENKIQYKQFVEYLNKVTLQAVCSIIKLYSELSDVSQQRNHALLSLYMRNVLLFPEAFATIVYHVFIMVCYIVPIVSAVMADGSLGRFWAILYFSIVNAAGSIVTFLAATPPAHLDPIKWTLIGLSLIAVGTGGIKPCVAAFGGDQLRIPQQNSLLAPFFSLFVFTANLGALIGMVLGPILRMATPCFENEFCYSLGFGVPAVLMVVAFVIFIAGKPKYRIKSARPNVMGQFVSCAFYAVARKLASRGPKKEHWLDYAAQKYDAALLRDMRKVFAILLVFVPLPVFWSLLVQQGSRWTFQATRMDGGLFGHQLLPDQIQAIAPLFILVLIPIFDKYIYPGLKTSKTLVHPLQKMTAGGLIAGLAFFCAAALEFRLEETYPVQPVGAEGHILLLNTLPCDLQIYLTNRTLTLPNGEFLTVVEKMLDHEPTKLQIYISTDDECGKRIQEKRTMSLTQTVNEGVIQTVVIGQLGTGEIATFPLEAEDLSKSLSGRPKFRLILMRGNIDNEAGPVTVTLYDKFELYSVFSIGKFSFNLSNYTELPPGRYTYYVTGFSESNEFQGFLDLKAGGVYSLVLREYQTEIEFAENLALTPPNHVHILWLIPQYLFMSIAEVMFAIPGLNFCYTQAPKSMKTVTMALWYLTVAMGNLIVIIVTERQPFTSQAHEFIFFAVQMLLAMVLFRWISSKFVHQQVVVVSASSSDLGEDDDHLSVMASEIAVHP